MCKGKNVCMADTLTSRISCGSCWLGRVCLVEGLCSISLIVSLSQLLHLTPPYLSVTAYTTGHLSSLILTVQAPKYHHSEWRGYPGCSCNHSGVHAAVYSSPVHCWPSLPVPSVWAPNQLSALHGKSHQPCQVLMAVVWACDAVWGHSVILFSS